MLNPLRDEQKLTSAQARDYTTRIKDILSSEQRDVVAQMAERRQGPMAGGTQGAGNGGGYPRGGGMGGYGGAPGGNTGGNAPRTMGGGAFDPSKLKDINPYYRDNSASGRYDGRKTMEELVALLEKSAGK